MAKQPTVMNTSEPVNKDLQVYEILEKIKKTRSNADKVSIMKSFKEHKPFYYLLRWNFDSRIVSMLPEGIPQFEPWMDEKDSPQNLWAFLNLFPEWVKGGPNVPNLKREASFISCLQSIEPQEAELLCLVKDKALTTKHKINPQVVKEAFPEFGIV